MPDVIKVSPFRCRMWDMHDRVEDLNETSCAGLIDSFKRHGQKHPVLGRLLKNDDQYDVELIYGARRLFAARHLGVPLAVQVRRIDDREALIEMDVENRVRTDISPYDRGMSYRRWLREGYFSSQSEIARSLGISEAQISKLLRYSELPAAVVQAFPSPHEIREEWAVTLAKLCREQGTRDVTVRRARACRASRCCKTPSQIYNFLIRGNEKGLRPPRARDEIVKAADGAPLLRIGFRAKTIHLILPRDKITAETLMRIKEEVAAAMEQVGSRVATGDGSAFEVVLRSTGG